MSLEKYIEFLNDNAQKNFAMNERYFAYNSKVFIELKAQVFQIIHCLINELHIPSLTSTNYLLERLLKISLIYNESKGGSFNFQTINSVYKLANKKYSNLTFEKTIEKNRQAGLIDDREMMFLDKKIRPLIRNTYSHGDPTKIRKTLPVKTKAFVAHLSDPSRLEEISFENDAIPTFQTQLFEDFAKKNSKIYFDFAFNLIFSIEEKINYFKDQR